MALVVVAGIALLPRLVHLDHPAFIDELNHVLAARSLLADGSWVISGEEPYLRARTFTWLVAAFFRLLGESLAAARLPSVLAGTALVVLVFAWVRWLAGSAAAWTAALLLCFDPLSLFLSQTARFYAVQALAFWTACICTYMVADRHWRGWKAVGGLAAAVVALLLARHLTQLAVVGMAGLGAGLVLVGHRAALSWITARTAHLLVTGTAAAALVVAAAAWWSSGGAADAWFLFNYTDMWAAGTRNYTRYYHDYLNRQYGTLWSLFPVLTLAALLVRPRPVLFCGAIFGTMFAFHSMTAWKVDRYIYYALPAFFIISGITAGTALAWLHRQATDAALKRARLRIPSALMSAVLVLLLLFTARFSWTVNNAFFQATAILTSGPTGRPPPYAQSDWEGALPHLRPWLDRGAVVVASANLKSIYSLGRMDYDVAAEHLNNLNGRQAEFTVLGKTGRPAVSRPESVAAIVACHAVGIVVVEEHHWGRDWAVPPETAAYITGRMEPIALPEELALRAFAWHTDVITENAGECPPGRQRAS
jgi:4-amino-4-deoxy-L-arabinose transferase-like glycosyltransferase